MNKDVLHEALVSQVQTTLDVLSMFKDDYLPERSKSKFEENKFNYFWLSKGIKYSEKELYAHVNEIIGRLPEGAINSFLNSGFILSNAIFHMHNENPDWIDKLGPIDERQFDNHTQNIVAGMIGLRNGFDLFEPKLPLSSLLITIFGPDAIRVLTMDSIEGGQGKIQPHECSRENWINLSNISSQASIENELIFFNNIDPFLTKLSVFAIWNVFATMTFIDPSVFISESDPNLSSSRSQGFTISQGGVHSIVEYYPKCFEKILKLLGEMIKNPLFGAYDMMWAAHGLLRVNSINRGFNQLTKDPSKKFKMFLSHRGIDSKRDLMMTILQNNLLNADLFLDCLTLPKGLINRNFVFKSLTNSDTIAIIRTHNFEHSIWCQKEETLAVLLNKIDNRKIKYFYTKEEVVKELSNLHEPIKRSKEQDKYDFLKDKEYVPWTTVRVIRDTENEVLGPNYITLQQKGYAPEIFEDLLNWIKGGYKDKKIQEIEKITYDLIVTLFQKLVNLERSKFNDKNYSPESFVVACQLSLGAVSIGSMDYEKMITRTYISHLNSLVNNIVKLAKEQDKLDNLIGYLVLSFCAIALQLAHNSYHNIANCGVKKLIENYAIYIDGLILLDFRNVDKMDFVLLKLISIMTLKYEIGTIGIIQHAESTVHENIIDGQSLEILPCVTFHDGMEALFL